MIDAGERLLARQADGLRNAYLAIVLAVRKETSHLSTNLFRPAWAIISTRIR